MIRELFLYFAKFPKRSGVTAMFTNGQSDYAEYQQLTEAIGAMEDEPILPDIENYVYGQDFDELKARVEKIFGSWLFADYGEFTFSEDRTPGSVRCQHKTLSWVNTIYARILADAAMGDTPWLSRMPVADAQIVPFVASELKSWGWTLIISADAADTLGTNSLKRSFLKKFL